MFYIFKSTKNYFICKTAYHYLFPCAKTQFFHALYLQYLIKDNNSWDVITMTPLGKTLERNYINNFHKIVNTSTVSGIIVKHNFLDKLLEVFKKANLIIDFTVPKCTFEVLKIAAKPKRAIGA